MSISVQERRTIAGIALIAVFTLGSIYEIGVRNFWFEAKNTYHTVVFNADGLNVGSVVSVSGLRVGEVSDLEVDEKNHIFVAMRVRRSIAGRLRADTVASVSRAFIIGEKRIELLPGTSSLAQLPNDAMIPSKDAMDLMEFLSGRRLGELIAQVNTLILGLNGTLKEADLMLSKYHSGVFDKTFEMVEPALRNFLRLSDDLLVMTKDVKPQSKNLPVLVQSGAQLFSGFQQDMLATHTMKNSLDKLDRVLTPLAERQQLISALLVNVADLSRDLSHDPQYGKQILNLVSQLDLTLRALQKTWLLEEHIDEVRSETTKTQVPP